MALLDVLDSGFQPSECDVPVRPRAQSLRDEAINMLVVALDKPTVEEAQQLCAELGDNVGVYKVGLELAMSKGGLGFARDLAESGRRVFLDMKLLDIGNTVQKAVANVARFGFEFLTVHATTRKTLRAAVAGRDSCPNSDLKLLAVTVLTDFEEADLEDEGIVGRTPHEEAVRRACMACEEGFDGVIASGHEAKAIRDATKAINKDFIIKVPGIRPSGTPSQDQKRTMTPAEAISRGADFIVVGRPIYLAKRPDVAASQIVEEIEEALRAKIKRA